MFGWLNRWGKQTQGGGVASPPTDLPTPAPAANNEPALWATHADTLAWTLGTPVPLAAHHGEASPPHPWGQVALRAVDAVLARSTLPTDLVPRAPAVIPQLLSLMRQDDLPLASIVERVVRDPLLTAEVMRLARSPHYRTRQRIETLEGAVTVLGAGGLQAAIARVVLRPLFRGDSAGLMGCAAERSWPHASRQAELAADLAAAQGLPRIEGFLAGLLHGSGRTALWRILDAQTQTSTLATAPWPPMPWDPALYAELAARSHCLFGQLALDWRITAALGEAGAALRHTQPATTYSGLPPLAALVLEAELRCTQELAQTPEVLATPDE
jgi:HD-like signal output (HDOD) protein